MTPEELALLITILLSVVAALLGLLVILLGWMGNKLYNRLVAIVETIAALDKTLGIEINKLDRRVTRVEEKHKSHLAMGHPA